MLIGKNKNDLLKDNQGLKTIIAEKEKKIISLQNGLLNCSTIRKVVIIHIDQQPLIKSFLPINLGLIFSMFHISLIIKYRQLPLYLVL
ncbi:MAG: hypothetical protein A3F72_19910 [Bacteroidetes bacterium RIFCSPLOWO2_12_FULL_35_15]|nr:MAG: hypothetical protein A3F72_19910 [Bacteroidetes bacterium RIFCSPLOWO2_12_FULL_35_15]